MKRLAWVLGLSLVTTSAFAQSGTRFPKLDPRLVRAFDTGVTGIMRPPSASLGRLNALLELDAPPDQQTLANIRSAGAEIKQAGGRAVAWRNWVVVRVDRSAAEQLVKLAAVKRLTFTPDGPAPLDVSASLIGLEAARGARPQIDRLTGQGTVIADVDSSVDPFHPVFFHADGGYYDWLDVDKDGVFTPGKDAIDLDRDGKVGATETAQALIAKTTDFGQPVPARTDDFDPSLDWLYLDLDGNGKRDFGSDAGFDDATPAFGEPLFTPDDVNQNGKLDPGERVVRLGTSKIRKVYIDSPYPPTPFTHVFERGVDLSTMKPDYSGGMAGYPDSLHATMVLSIAAGDVPLVGRRHVGMAPDAELVVASKGGGEPAAGVIWALGEKPDVVLHEMANWTGSPLDGSDPISQVVDQSTTQDQITHTCPTGNMAPSYKHARLTIDGGAKQTLKFDVPSWLGSAGLYYLDVSLNVRGAPSLVATLTEPSGTAHPLDQAGISQIGTIASLYSTQETTPRSTFFVDGVIYTDQPTAGAIPTGTWTVDLEVPGTVAATVDAYVADNVSSWSKGAAWQASSAVIADNTIGVPSTSDHCIAIGAFPGHLHSAMTPWFTGDEAAGTIRDYSGRGPRIDGVQKPDLLAPDNPWAAYGHDTEGKIANGSMMIGSGTSAASPHVTGVTALLAQAGIRGDAAREALRKGAIKDSVTGTTPNATYGYGRLSAAGALGVPADGKPPQIALVAKPDVASVGQIVTLEASATDPDGTPSAIEIQWDDGYDGSWDLPYAPIAAREVTAPKPGRVGYKARVRDASGRIAEAVTWVTFSQSVPAADGGVPSSDGGGAGSGATPRSSDDGGGCGCRLVSPVGSTGGFVSIAIGLLFALGRVRGRIRIRTTAQK